MMTLLFGVCFLWLVFKLIGFAFKATWSITKVIVTILLFPIAAMVFAFSGMMFLALPLLLIGSVFAYAS